MNSISNKKWFLLSLYSLSVILALFLAIIGLICQWLFGFGGEVGGFCLLYTLVGSLISVSFRDSLLIHSFKKEDEETSTNDSFNQQHTTYTKTSQSSSTTNYGINIKK